LVIIYNSVPGSEGIRLCNALKTDDETGLIPLLLLYGKGTEDSIIKGFECGVEACMVHPFNMNLLKARVKNLIENRKHLMEKIRLQAISKPVPAYVQVKVSEFMDQVHDILENNLSNQLFTVEKLSNKLHMSRATMYRQFRAQTGKSPQLYIQSYRLMRAAQLLENKERNITEICFMVGFTSTAYFAKCFKEKFLQSPKAFANSRITGGEKKKE
jgi:AraC-like DNA-binding protein